MAVPDTTFWQAVSALAPLVGGGGIASVVVAFLGFRKSAQSGGKASISPDATMAIGALYADRDALERMIQSADRVAGGLEKVARQFGGDGMDEIRQLRRALEDNTDAQKHRR